MFPQSSVAVKVTKAEPEFPQPLLNVEKLLVQVTLEQVSEAEAPPLEANHVAKAAELPFPSHSTVTSAAAIVIVGLVVS